MKTIDPYTLVRPDDPPDFSAEMTGRRRRRRKEALFYFRTSPYV
jgi:hypothetical protein